MRFLWRPGDKIEATSSHVHTVLVNGTEYKELNIELHITKYRRSATVQTIA